MLAGNRQPLFRLELLVSFFHGNTLYEGGVLHFKLENSPTFLCGGKEK
jgi:hypothetical protein